jgi:hypothetical protein
VLVVVDGLRLDASRRMPFLNELRRRGADFVARVGTPSYSRSGRATLAIGSWPEIHGVTTNRHREAARVDNLIRAVARAGKTCRVAGSPIWPSLFGEDIAQCGEALRLKTKEGPGRFPSLRSAIETSERNALEFLLSRRGDLTIVDFVATDAAAHDRGGRSQEYEAEVLRVDGLIRELVEAISLEDAAVVVTADHGHLDIGGHGSSEREVIEVPAVWAGQGVRSGVSGTMGHVDVAPTIAALLGITIPGGAQGRIATELLAVPPETARTLEAAARRQQDRFARAYAEGGAVTLASAANPNPDPSIEDVHSAIVRSEQRRRAPLGLAMGLASLALLVFQWARRGAGERRGLFLGVIGYAIGYAALLVATGKPLTLSGINYDQQVDAFFRPFLVYAFVAYLAATLWLLWRAGAASFARLWALAQSLAVVIAAVLALGLTLAYWRDGLLSQLTVAPVPVLFATFVASLQIVGVAAGALASAIAAWAFSRRRSRS